jgi:membrane protease YdiL (CAAX protease family)
MSRLYRQNRFVMDNLAPNLPDTPVAGSGRPRITDALQRKALLVWVVVAFLPSLLLILPLMRLLHANPSELTVHTDLAVKGVQSLFVVLATWMAARVIQRPLDEIGMPPRQALGLRFWEGCMWGFAMLSAVLLIIRLTGHFEIISVALSGGAILKYAVGWALVFLFVAISEEFVFRGFLLFSLSRRLTFWPAALFLSVMFGAAHLGNHGESVLGILQVVVIGLIFCLTIRRTGTLWFAVGFHAAWDWAQTFFFGTADSGLVGVGHLLNSTSAGPTWITGGAPGPEGSLIALAVLLVFALLVHLRFPNVVYPDKPE